MVHRYGPQIFMCTSEYDHVWRYGLQSTEVENKTVSHCYVQLFATPWTVSHQAPSAHGILQARILEWVAMPLSRPRDRTFIFCIAGRFFTIWATREAHQFSSVTQSCPTLCDPMDHSMPALPVHHQLPQFTQTHVHCVGDAIQPSHPLSSPSPPALNLSQNQGLFKWVRFLHQVTKLLEFQLQPQSFQWTPRTDLL